MLSCAVAIRDGEALMTTKPIVRHAPYLRRYARALTGSQADGDALVQATLETLLHGGVALTGDAPLRVGLYRALHATWRKALNGRSIDAPGRRHIADLRLQRMTPEHRSALLLVAMEGFTWAEAATILDVSEAVARRRYAAAQASVERQLATEVLIIEDEPVIAVDLERIVREMGHRVVGVAATRDEALAIAAAAPPGLVLADVRLADGSSGADAVGDILERQDAPVIFVTAFPETLLTGRRPEPAFLVPKPFQTATLKALIGQALFFHQPRPQLHLV
jgi:DNA-directed RNA polymerase specialized sigma24 family protein